MHTKKSGFSLVEMMICLAIAAILAAICYPSYMQHVVSLRRHRAELALLQAATRMETYYSSTDSYEGATLKLLHLEHLITDGSYQLAIESTDEDHYSLSATPLGTQLQSDHCGKLSLDETGKQTANGKMPENCWIN
jgi:type IV pilus assembly protein PilE